MNIPTNCNVIGRVANKVCLKKYKGTPYVQILLYVSDNYHAKLIPIVAKGNISYNFNNQIKQGNLLEVKIGLDTMSTTNNSISLALIATLLEFKPLETKFQRNYYEGDGQRVKYLFPIAPQNFKHRMENKNSSVSNALNKQDNAVVGPEKQELKTENKEIVNKTAFKQTGSWLDELGAVTSFGFPQMQ